MYQILIFIKSAKTAQPPAHPPRAGGLPIFSFGHVLASYFLLDLDAGLVMVSQGDANHIFARSIFLNDIRTGLQKLFPEALRS